MARLLTRLGSRLGALVAAVALALLGVLLDATSAWACSCAGLTTQESLDAAEAVFVGEVSEAAVHRDRLDLRFAVDRVYKGSVYADQAVTTHSQEPSCGFGAQPGSTWIVFARTEYVRIGDQTVTRLTTNACSGNIRGDRAPEELTRARVPLSGSSDRVEQTLVADVRLTRVLIAAGAGVAVVGLAVALAVGLGWRRRRTG